MPKFIAPVAANVRLAESQPEYEPISVRRDIVPYDMRDGNPPAYVPMFTACLEFTPEELAQVREQHGKCYLVIMGNGWPPCLVTVTDENLELLTNDKTT